MVDCVINDIAFTCVGTPQYTYTLQNFYSQFVGDSNKQLLLQNLISNN